MTSPSVFVLANSKRRHVWSDYITRALCAAGVDTYRVTPLANPRFSPERIKMVINYGVSFVPVWWDRLPDDCVVLNDPAQVAISANKLAMMRKFAEVCPGKHLEFYTDRECAQAAIDNGEVIIARTLLRSHSGRGIRLSPPDALPEARLYTVLKRGTNIREYRVFMMNGEFMDVVQKKRKSLDKLLETVSAEEAENWWKCRYRQVVRAWKNGWAFCHNNLNVTDQNVFDEIAATGSKFLSWGCVDVLIDSETKEWWLVEINSAIGMDAGNTQEAYINAFVKLYNSLN